jgi:uncharacterized protein
MSRAGTIDGWKLARERGVVTGALGLAELERLAELGCEAAAVDYSIRGGKSATARPNLTIAAEGALRLVCQRCVRPLEYPFAVTTELELAATEAELLNAPDDVERVLASQAMDIASLVEDELILALPIAPAHEHCELPPARIQSGIDPPQSVNGNQREQCLKERDHSVSLLRGQY